MRGTCSRSAGKSFVAVLAAACFLAMSLGPVSRTAAASSWETWPKQKAAPALGQEPAIDTSVVDNALKTKPEIVAEPREELKPAPKRSYGKIGWIALGIAAAVGIGIAAAGGGGGGGGVVTNPGHQ